ncbi:unnamed protein product [Protopolystoma xenopodis]|uniref:Uncharacterized protein n=1 Tax=Protopolystoma xenopodis TaxID=117903 RepID=A0A448WVU7_9PLAT|nr:unnamed protein product [Protopolystoma xenopodis]
MIMTTVTGDSAGGHFSSGASNGVNQANGGIAVLKKPKGVCGI